MLERDVKASSGAFGNLVEVEKMRACGIEGVGEQEALTAFVTRLLDDVPGPRRGLVVGVDHVLRADMTVAHACSGLAGNDIAGVHDAVVGAAPLVHNVRDSCVVADARSTEGSLVTMKYQRYERQVGRPGELYSLTKSTMAPLSLRFAAASVAIAPPSECPVTTSV